MLGGVKPLPSQDLSHILEHTGTLWKGVPKGRIFISGGTGFFGVWLLESLAYCNRKLNLDVKATVLSRNPEAFLSRLPHMADESSFEWFKGDVRSFVIPEGTFDFVLHGAAPTTNHEAQKPSELKSCLVDGAERMLDLASSCGAKRFLYLSSGAVYGEQPEGLSHIPESYRGTPERPDGDNAYAEGKRASETMCKLFANETGIPCTIARCFAFVGPHLPLDQHFAIGNFIADALAGRNIQIRGDGTPTRSYMYAADLAIWLWTLLFQGAESCESPAVFNVGSARGISIRDLAQEVVNEINPGLKIEVAGRSALGAQRTQYVPEIQKAETSLGLRQTIGLRDAIRRTADWYR